MAVDFKYRAFISYSHADHKSAVWLHKALEKYPIHKKLVGLQTPAGKTARRLGRVFRDEAEIGAVPELGPKIEAALQASDTLIVLCSPRSAQSEWVAQEITRFKELGRQHRVLALILDGEPHAADPAQECFPEPLKRNPDGTPVQPLAVDVRKFGREDALVRIVSGILEIDYDALKQRDLQRRRAEMRRAQGLFAAGLILLASALGAGFLALQGFSDLAHAKSDILAREAKVIFDDGAGDKSKSLLMALQADPSANRSLLRRVFSGTNGYPLARARLVSAYASRRLEKVFRGHRDSVSDVVYAPDGETLLTTSWDGTAKIWDVTTGDMLRSVYGGERIGASGVFSHDGQTVFVTQDTTIQKWDLAFDELIPFGTGHTADVVDLTVSGDGRFLASAAWDNTAKLWDVASGQIVRSLDDHDYIVTSVAFSPDSRIVATGSGTISSGETKLWDVASGALLQTFTGHGDVVSAIAFSSDGYYMATGSGDATVQIWDLTSNTQLNTLRAHTDLVRGVAFSPDGNFLVTSSADDTIRIWNPFTSTPLAVISSHNGEVGDISFSPDGKSFATASADGTARTWAIVPGDLIARLEHPGSTIGVGPMYALSYSPDGTQILTSHDTEHALLWDAVTGSLLRTLHVPDTRIAASAFSPDGNWIATGLSDGTIRIWNRQSGEQVQSLVGHTEFINQLSFSPDGLTLVSGDSGGFVFVWDMSTGRMRNIIPAGKLPIDTLKFAQDGLSFVTLNMAGQSNTWSVTTGEKLANFNQELSFNGAVDFSPNGKRIVTGNMSGQVQEWELATAALQTTFSSTESEIWTVAYSPDGNFLVAGTGHSEGGKVKIWDTLTGETIMEYVGHSTPVTKLAISPDARSFANDNPIGGTGESIADVWRVPDIIYASPKQQVRMACEMLWASNSPLYFTQADAQTHPILLGEPVDPETGDFVSPCADVLPDEAFAP
ncbi:MAG: TIR domain-containing protein [Pseudomonadota bacterium]